MRLEHQFSVPLSPSSVWDTMLGDLDGVVSCIPGAELTETLAPGSWAGRFTAKMGPISLGFSGNVQVEELNQAERRLILRAGGSEDRGRGTVQVVVTLVAHGDGQGNGQGEGSSIVNMTSEVTMTGRVAQMSRGMLPKVARDLTGRFATCLAARFDGGDR